MWPIRAQPGDLVKMVQPQTHTHSLSLSLSLSCMGAAPSKEPVLHVAAAITQKSDTVSHFNARILSLAKFEHPRINSGWKDTSLRGGGRVRVWCVVWLRCSFTRAPRAHASPIAGATRASGPTAVTQQQHRMCRARATPVSETRGRRAAARRGGRAGLFDQFQPRSRVDAFGDRLRRDGGPPPCGVRL